MPHDEASDRERLLKRNSRSPAPCRLYATVSPFAARQPRAHSSPAGARAAEPTLELLGGVAFDLLLLLPRVLLLLHDLHRPLAARLSVGGGGPLPNTCLSLSTSKGLFVVCSEVPRASR